MNAGYGLGIEALETSIITWHSHHEVWSNYGDKCWHTWLKEWWHWCCIISGPHTSRILFHCGMANIGSLTFTVNTDSSFILRLPPTSCRLQYQYCKWWKAGWRPGKEATPLFEEQQFKNSTLKAFNTTKPTYHYCHKKTWLNDAPFITACSG